MCSVVGDATEFYKYKTPKIFCSVHYTTFHHWLRLWNINRVVIGEFNEFLYKDVLNPAIYKLTSKGDTEISYTVYCISTNSFSSGIKYFVNVIHFTCMLWSPKIYHFLIKEFALIKYSHTHYHLHSKLRFNVNVTVICKLQGNLTFIEYEVAMKLPNSTSKGGSCIGLDLKFISVSSMQF